MDEKVVLIRLSFMVRLSRTIGCRLLYKSGLKDRILQISF
jgi:hypothetical protein